MEKSNAREAYKRHRKPRTVDFYLRKLLKESRRPDHYFVMHGIIIQEHGTDIVVASWGGFYNIKIARSLPVNSKLQVGQEIYLMVSFLPASFNFVVLGKTITKEEYEQALEASKERNAFFRQLEKTKYIEMRQEKAKKWKEKMKKEGGDHGN